MHQAFHWINEPTTWADKDGVLSVVTDAQTDFWRETWYGFERFSGHIYATEVSGDFTFQVRVRADFDTLYDQAGIMVMQDERHWLKAGIEYNDGAPAIGSVLTLGKSDWATGSYSGDPREFWLRLATLAIFHGRSPLASAAPVPFSNRDGKGRCDVLYAATQRTQSRFPRSFAAAAE